MKYSSFLIPQRKINVGFRASARPAATAYSSFYFSYGFVGWVEARNPTHHFSGFSIDNQCILSTVIICAFVKRLCKPFYRKNDLQNRFTENSESADYAGGQYMSGFMPHFISHTRAEEYNHRF